MRKLRTAHFTYTYARLTLVLLELVKVGRLDPQRVPPEAVDLPRDRPPEHLVKHRIGHVVVCAATLVLWYRKRMLLIVSCDLPLPSPLVP